MIKATRFYNEIVRLEERIVTEIKNIMAANDVTCVEFAKADDESIDWCDKLTIEYEDDYTGKVQNVVVERLTIVEDKLFVEAKEPDYLDEIGIWESSLNVYSLCSIHTEVCNRLGAIQHEF